MRELKKFINWISKPRVFFFLFLIILLILVIPDFIPAPIGPYAFKQHANGYPLIDTLVNYSPYKLYELLQGYGQIGRNYYILCSLTLDLIIPMSLMLFVIASFNLISRNTRISRFMYKLMAIPLLGLLFDYAENLSIITMILKYPEKLYSLATIANVFTLLKGLFVFAGILIALFGLLIKSGILIKKYFKGGK
jgi:hypothetical protein